MRYRKPTSSRATKRHPIAEALPTPRHASEVTAASTESVDVYLVRPSAGLADAALQWLDDADRSRLERMTHPRARASFLLGRWLVRGVLGAALDTAPAALRFVDNRWGRPELDRQRHPTLSDVRFNLSHTAGLGALVVTRGREVGIDVEHTERQSKTVAIADRFFATSEVAELRALPSHAVQRDRFFDYWTLKESYIKARGMGLAIPLGAFSFDLTGPTPVVTTAPSLHDHSSWRFQLWTPGPAHRAALCIEMLADPAPVRVRWCEEAEPSACLHGERADSEPHA